MKTIITTLCILLITNLSGQNIGINNADPLAKLDIKGEGDGTELLRLSTERPWVFKQTGDGFLAKLTLKPTTNFKLFEIVTDSDSVQVAEFVAYDPEPRVYLIPEAGRLGIGTKSPNARVNIHGTPDLTENLLRLWVTHDDNLDTRGIDCESKPAEGYGIGGDFIAGHRGVRGIVEAGNSARLGIGVVGAASGSNNMGTRVGLWGNAFGGNVNWAGYFENGNVFITNDLRIGSGAIDGAAGYKVAVKGKIIAEEMRINLQSNWPDYVFDKNYELMSIKELEESILSEHHLPGIPSALEIAEEGLIVGEMQTKMMEKIEELTLYIIEINNELSKVKKQLEELTISKQ